MSDEILPVPPVPDGIKEAAIRGTLIPFIGAGASRLGGCPTWSQFADRALGFFVEQGKFSHSQLAQISHLNPRVKLSIALGLQEENGIQINFGMLLHPSGRRDDPKGRRLYESLSKLGKTFVTTNYDQWLDDELIATTPQFEPNAKSTVLPDIRPRTVVHNIADLTPANLNKPDTVIHLHGSLLDPKGMVLTTHDYVRHYANDRRLHKNDIENRVLTFLEYLFQQKTVLFVGYGLEELEILEYVILKAHQVPGQREREAKHYLLQGFFSHEYELMRSLRRYYLSQCGIELIPFLRDHHDWDQLIDVLEQFAKTAPASAPMRSQKMKEMKALLDG